MEIEVVSLPEEAYDEGGIEYFGIKLSNGMELRLYGNGISLDQSEYILTYEDIIRYLMGELIILEPEEGGVEA